jgi:hypothetical protein
MLSCLVYIDVSFKCLVCIVVNWIVYGSNCLVHLVVILCVFVVLSVLMFLL